MQHRFCLATLDFWECVWSLLHNGHPLLAHVWSSGVPVMAKLTVEQPAQDTHTDCFFWISLAENCLCRDLVGCNVFSVSTLYTSTFLFLFHSHGKQEVLRKEKTKKQWLGLPEVPPQYSVITDFLWGAFGSEAGTQVATTGHKHRAHRIGVSKGCCGGGGALWPCFGALLCV